MSIYFLRHLYTPNNAATNRFFAFAKALSKTGRKVEIIFIYPNKNYEVYHDKIDNIKIRYIWKEIKCKRSIKLFILSLFRFWKSLHKGDVLFVSGAINEFIFYSLKRRIKIYHEITEYPLLIPPRTFIQKTLSNLYFIMSKKADALFVISKGLKEFFVSKGIIANKIFIVNMFCDVDRFKNINIIEDENEYITYCGTLNTYKDGVDILIKSYSNIRDEYPKVKLLLIGPYTSEDDRITLNQLISELSLEKDVILTGEKDTIDIPPLLLTSKILVLARPDSLQARYGFPTKLGEYLCSGKPVIVTNVGEITNYLKSGENAFIAEPSSVISLSDNLKLILDNYDSARKVGLNGKMIVNTQFNSEIEIQKIQYLF